MPRRPPRGRSEAESIDLDDRGAMTMFRLA
jgi:hypothetical protein